MQVKDKEAGTVVRDLEVWGQRGGGASINIGQEPPERREAGGLILVKPEGAQTASKQWRWALQSSKAATTPF